MMTPTKTFRIVLLFSAICILITAFTLKGKKSVPPTPQPQQVIVLMLDGLGLQYIQASDMPHLKQMCEKGFYKEVKALMPSVTNANNASICCGVFPDEHGITGNSFLDEKGVEQYMESGDLLLSPTLFEKAKKKGVKSALLSSKKKSIGLLGKGANLLLSPEIPDTAAWVKKLGTPPPIYSREVNYWLMDAALFLLKERQNIGCIYIHTTDYPMHTWAPGATESKEHLKKLDEYLGKIMEAAPGACILITADHDVNHKTGCWDLDKACLKRKTPIKMAISAERDKYLKHHRGFGGVSYVYLNQAGDAPKVKQTLSGLPGVKQVLTADEAAKKYHLMKKRIGDLVVIADSVTVFGNLEKQEYETLPENYRTHGSEYECSIPLVIYGAKNLPAASNFEYNKDLTKWLYK